MKRDHGVDAIKAMATFFVIVLHINGYAVSTQGLEIATTSTRFAYYFMEACCFCAVNIFILCGSYIIASKQTVKLRQPIRIWLTAFIIGILGVGVAYILGIKLSTIGILRSLLPISFRAYGFITSYMILLVLSPLLNLAVFKMSDRQVLYICIVLGLILVVLPSIVSLIGWHGNYTASFFFLYFISIYLKRRLGAGDQIHKYALRLFGGILWLIATGILIASPYVLKYVSKIIPLFEDHELHFYDYSNILVMCQAIGLFLLFVGRTISLRTGHVVEYLAKNSMIVYLFHMHPVLKNSYSKWGVIQNIYSPNGFQYIMRVILFALVVYAVGIVVSRIVSYLVIKIIPIIMNAVNKNKRILNILTEIGFDCR